MSQTNRRGSVIFLHGLQSPNFWVWLWHVYTLALPTSVLRNRYLSSFYCTLAIIFYSFVGAGPLDGLGRRKGGRRSQRPSRTMCMAQNSHGYPLTTAGIVSRQRQGPGCNKRGEGLVKLVLYQVNFSPPFTLTLFEPSPSLVLPLSCCRCESHQQGLEARRHIQDHLASPYFLHVCGEASSQSLLKWLANSFFSVQHKLLFFYRLDIRCFDEYVNSAIESQHAAIKTTHSGT